MKSPFVDKSRNESGQREFSIHCLSENDLLDLHYIITSELARIRRYAKLLDDEILDLMLKRRTAKDGMLKPRQSSIDCLTNLSKHFHRQRHRLAAITSDIERVNDKAREFMSDEVPPQYLTFKSAMNNEDL